jgi:hypothetical protein
MAFATLNDLLQVEPTIQDYGVLDWDFELARSQTELIRIIQVRWFQTFKSRNPSAIFDATLLTDSQWTMACVYHAMAYHICPKLTQFSQSGNEDKFQVMMEYYAGRFEHEFDLVVRLGVEYDLDDSGTVSTTEKESLTQLRLVR